MKPSTSNPTAWILGSFHVLVQNVEGEETFDSKAVTQFLQQKIHVYKYCINKPTMSRPHCTHAKREERVGFDALCVFTGLMQQVCTFCRSKRDGRKMKLPNAAVFLCDNRTRTFLGSRATTALTGSQSCRVKTCSSFIERFEIICVSGRVGRFGTCSDEIWRLGDFLKSLIQIFLCLLCILDVYKMQRMSS